MASIFDFLNAVDPQQTMPRDQGTMFEMLQRQFNGTPGGNYGAPPSPGTLEQMQRALPPAPAPQQGGQGMLADMGAAAGGQLGMPPQAPQPAPQQPQMPGFMQSSGLGPLDKMHQFITENRGGLAGLGAAIQQGRPVGYGVMQGQEIDKKRKDEEEEKTREKNFADATSAFIKEPWMQAMIKADPRKASEVVKLFQDQKKEQNDQDYRNRSLSLQEAQLKQRSGAKTFEQTDAERVEAMKRAGVDPEGPQGKHFRLTGDLPKDSQKTFTAGDRQFVRKTLTETGGLQSGIDQLEQAYRLASPTKGKDGKETYAIEGGQGWLGLEGMTTGIRDKTGIGADGRTAKTVEFNRILRSAAIQQVLSQFKGATTDTELNQAIGIVGDANNSVEARMAALKRVLNGMYDTRDGNLDQVEEAYKLGGTEPDAMFKKLSTKRKRVFSDGDDGVLWSQGGITVRKAD